MSGSMKAWVCREEWEFNGTVCFAETAGKARYIAMCSDTLGDDLTFRDIHVRRAKELDKYYRGLNEMDWDNMEDRIAMVREEHFRCSPDYVDTSDCIKCPAKEWCDEWENGEEELSDE